MTVLEIQRAYGHAPLQNPWCIIPDTVIPSKHHWVSFPVWTIHPAGARRTTGEQRQVPACLRFVFDRSSLSGYPVTTEPCFCNACRPKGPRQAVDPGNKFFLLEIMMLHSSPTARSCPAERLCRLRTHDDQKAPVFPAGAAVNNSSRFFSNTQCAYFPCHKGADPETFNCLFCYCPLYLAPRCIGHPEWLPNGIKDCSHCMEPHRPENYPRIIQELSGTIREQAALRQSGKRP